VLQVRVRKPRGGRENKRKMVDLIEDEDFFNAYTYGEDFKKKG